MIREYRMKHKLSQRLEHNEENTRLSTFKKIVKALDISDEEIIKFIKKNK